MNYFLIYFFSYLFIQDIIILLKKKKKKKLNKIKIIRKKKLIKEIPFIFKIKIKCSLFKFNMGNIKRD